MHVLPSVQASPDVPFEPVEAPDADPAPTRAARASAGVCEAHLIACVEGIRRREEAALGALYDATISLLFGAAVRVLRDEESSEEVVSDVYLQVWREPDRYDVARGSVRTWLLVMCRSRALDALRRRQPAVVHLDPDELGEAQQDGALGPEDLMLAVEEGTRVRECLLSLTPWQRQLLSLAFFRGMSHSEIAAIEGSPLGTVKGQIRQALQTMRVQLERTHEAGKI